MSRDPTGATRREALTLAGASVLAGTTTLAGCSGFGLPGSDEPTISGSRLQSALGRKIPTVETRLPVDIEQRHFDAHRHRARSLLERVPTPMTADDIPNAAIRREIVQRVEHATAALDRSRTAPSAFQTLETLRNAREMAAAAAWAMDLIRGERFLATIRPAARDQGDALGSFRGRWRYVGSRPVPALLVPATVERWVHGARTGIDRILDGRRSTGDNPVDRGELGAEIESARALLVDASYVFDQYRTSLDESGLLRETFTAAARSLDGTIEERRADLPETESEQPSELVDRNVDDTPIGEALTNVFQAIEYVNDSAELVENRPGSAVLAAHATLVHIAAFRSLCERVERGEYVTVESAADVETLHERAIDALQAALAARATPLLNREQVVVLLDEIRSTADRFRDRDRSEPVERESLVYGLGEYVSVAALAEATPPSSATVAAAVRTDAR